MASCVTLSSGLSSTASLTSSAQLRPSSPTGSATSRPRPSFSGSTPRLAEIGGAPSHPLATQIRSRSSRSFRSQDRPAPVLSQSLYDRKERERANSLMTPPPSGTSRSRHGWVRRRGVEQARTDSSSALDSPISSAIKGLSLPTTSGILPSATVPSDKIPSASTPRATGSSSLARLFSKRRRPRSAPATEVLAHPTAFKRIGAGEELDQVQLEQKGSRRGYEFPRKGASTAEGDRSTQANAADPKEAAANEEVRIANRDPSDLHRPGSVPLDKLSSSHVLKVDKTAQSSPAAQAAATFAAPLRRSESKASFVQRFRKPSLPSHNIATSSASDVLTHHSTSKSLSSAPASVGSIVLAQQRPSPLAGEGNSGNGQNPGHSLFRKLSGRLHSRTKSMSRDDAPPSSMDNRSRWGMEGRMRKLSLRDVKTAKAATRVESDGVSNILTSSQNEITPRMDSVSSIGGDVRPVKAERPAETGPNSRTIPQIADAGSRTDRSISLQRESALGLVTGEERKNEDDFVSGLDAISSGWTETSSQHGSSTPTRKPVPSLSLQVGGNSNDGSVRGRDRAYSFISSDTDGNDTPIFRLQKLVVDTRVAEDEEERQRESQLFFRPPAAGGVRVNSAGSSRTHGIEQLRDLNDPDRSPDAAASVSEVGPMDTEASVRSWGSSTLNVRLYKEKMARNLQQQGEREEAHNSPPIVSTEGHGETSADSQLRPPPRALPLRDRDSVISAGRQRHSTSTHISTDSGLGGMSSPTESSIQDAILSRATSTRLYAAPLRRMKVQEWAQKLAAAEAESEHTKDATIAQAALADGGTTNAIPDIPDEPSSGHGSDTLASADRKPEFTFRSSTRPGSEQAAVSPLGTAEVDDAARLGKVPSKRVRRHQATDTSGDLSLKNSGEQLLPMEKIDPPGLLKESVKVNLHPRVESEAVYEGNPPLLKHEKSKLSKHRSHRSGDYSANDRKLPQGRSISHKKSYMTSEEAAAAKRKEQEEREWRRKERKRQKEAARQEAYAEKKRKDPLLKMRLALAGLSPPGEAGDTVEDDKSNIQAQHLGISLPSEAKTSKTSFHTAEEEEAEPVQEEQEDVYESPRDEIQLPRQYQPAQPSHSQSQSQSRSEREYRHQRNKASTSSEVTLKGHHSRSSSAFTLASAAPIPFPQPPKRYDQPTRADDGTVLSRARLQSNDGLLPAMTASATAEPYHQIPDDLIVVIDGRKVALSRGASVRESPVQQKKPEMVIQALRGHLETDDAARLRHSHVPEVRERFSIQSIASTGPEGRP